jgi:hypothetical protein
MKFNKQIFTILILALFVPLAMSASTHTDGAKEKKCKSGYVFEHHA